jgi:putative membrane protein
MKHPRRITAQAAVFLEIIRGAGPAYAQWGPGPEHMHSFWGGMGWTGMVFALLILILLALILILIVRWLLQNSQSRGQSNVSINPPSKAMKLLKERYARGEIDREEFEQKKQDLS